MSEETVGSVEETEKKTFSAEIRYFTGIGQGYQERTHFFKNFPSQEALEIAIDAHERFLEVQYKYGWGRRGDAKYA